MQHADTGIVLSIYQRYILDSIISHMHPDAHFNILELVQDAISHKNILPGMNFIVLETSFALKEFLLAQQLINEQTEMTAYYLTSKGLILKACGSVEAFERRGLKQSKLSMFQKIFTHSVQDSTIDHVKKANDLKL